MATLLHAQEGGVELPVRAQFAGNSPSEIEYWCARRDLGFVQNRGAGGSRYTPFVSRFA